MMKISFFSRIKKFVADTRKKSKGITLGEFTRSYADERRKEGEKIYEGRCGSVLGMLKHLETFGGSDIPLKKVDVETIKQFIDYLRSAHDLHKNMKAPRKLSDSTIHLKVNILKSVLREAVRLGLLDQNPFDRLPSSYRIHPHYKEKETLTMEDLITLKQTPCKTPQLKEAVLLSSLTGLRKSDILSLNHDDIIEIEGTPYIYKKGDNVIAVKVDNSDQPNSRWYSGCGIYRHVWLTKTLKKAYIPQWGQYVATTPKGDVKVKVDFHASGSRMKLSIRNTIYDAAGKVVARSQGDQNQKLKVRKPHLWSIGKGYLYTVKSELVVNGKVVDTATTQTAFRDVRLDRKSVV